MMKIDIERYNKSTMLEDAENILWPTLGIELTTSTTLPSTAQSLTSTNCAIETTSKKIVRYRFMMKIDIERYNKSNMPENAEKYFMTHHGNLTYDLENTA